MGARGKKRRRADGSVADGRTTAKTSTRANVVDDKFYELDAIPIDMLATSVDISSRHFPLDRAEPGDDYNSFRELLLDDRHDAVWEALFEETDALASTNGVDVESLDIRTEKLIEFLRLPGNQGLYAVDVDNGRVTVDPSLLAFAASTPMTNETHDKLVWSPDQHVPPNLE